MKSLIRNTKWTWVSMLLIGAISFGIFSCSDDDTNVNADGIEAENASVVSYQIESPSGARIQYMSIHNEFPDEIDFSNGIELGINVTVRSIGEHIFTINSDASTITKWSVDRVTLLPQALGVLSYASTGVKIDETLQFYDENQAFISDFNEGLVVELNLDLMTIENTYNFSPHMYASQSNIATRHGTGTVYNGKVIWPIEASVPECCEYIDLGGALIAVFDPSSATLAYKQDARLIAADSKLVFGDNGDIYIQPARQNSFIRPYFDVDMSTIGKPFVVLKLDENGGFDPSFEFDLESPLGLTFWAQSPFIADNKMVLSYADNTFNFPEFDQKWSAYGNLQPISYIDLATGDVEEFTAFSSYTNSEILNSVENRNYFAANALDEGTNMWSSQLLVQNSINDYEVITIISDNSNVFFRYYNKLW